MMNDLTNKYNALTLGGNFGGSGGSLPTSTPPQQGSYDPAAGLLNTLPRGISIPPQPVAQQGPSIEDQFMPTLQGLFQLSQAFPMFKDQFGAMAGGLQSMAAQLAVSSEPTVRPLT